MRARFSSARITSYLALLLEAGNPSQIACSSCSLVGDRKSIPIPDPKTQEAPPTCSFLKEPVDC